MTIVRSPARCLAGKRRQPAEAVIASRITCCWGRLRMDGTNCNSSPATLISLEVMDPATDDLLGPSERQDDDGQRASGDDARLTDPGDAKHAAPRVDVIAARAVGSATHSSPAPVRSVALQVPSRDELEAIARRQDAKHAAMQAAKPQGQRDEEEAAAALIQRNYRGYKQRRELAGMGLDPSTRWVEVCETLLSSPLLEATALHLHTIALPALLPKPSIEGSVDQLTVICALHRLSKRVSS